MPIIVQPLYILTGPIRNYNHKNPKIPYTEFHIREDFVTVQDNPWNLEGITEKRTASFINIHKYDEYGWYEPNTIQGIMLSLDNKSVMYERTVQSYVDALCESGGLIDILFIVFFSLNWTIIKPFETLQILQDFQAMS